MSISSALKVRHRISRLLFVVLTSIACLVLLGLVVMTVRLMEIRTDLGTLRSNALPRLAKLSQLSQEASATISIAPALSAKPTRFEFETLLSRIKDKEESQKGLIEELGDLVRNADAARKLRENGDLLIDNLQILTDVVRRQITVRKRLDDHVEYFRRLARSLSPQPVPSATVGVAANGRVKAYSERVRRLANAGVYKILNGLLDPNRARFSRNKSEIEAGFEDLARALDDTQALAPDKIKGPLAISQALTRHWSSERNKIYDDKAAELANEFRIKALVEENSLIANRLLGSANKEFGQASAELETQIRRVDQTTQFTLASMFFVLVAFGVGNFFVWFVLQKRVLRRLDRMRDALQTFADSRMRTPADPVRDEIGEISRSLIHYMTVIDEREAELAEKTNAMEQLSNQLAKYLSPQVYESIFTGQREVKVASSRKKLTVFFSDIEGFTETADRLESEELTQLLNDYLTEMSRIALDHGATIDKYVGDAIVIFFGDPETKGVKEDALACVKMAIAMRGRLNDLEDIWRQAGIEKPLRSRMGIHTGFCTVGNFGSEDRMDYTIIGGAVNTAARLETLAESGEILISYETFALIRDEIQCKEHGEVEVKGIAYPVAVFQVEDSYANLGHMRRRFQENHPNVKLELELDAMTAQDRGKAAEILHRALEVLSQSEGRDHKKPTVKTESKS